MAPVLVTGATGYTGQRLVRRLVDAGTAVRAVVRATSDVSVLPESVQLIQADLDDPASMQAVGNGVHRVLHLAHVRHTANLLAALSEDVEHIVIVSSLRAQSRVPSPSVQQVLMGEAAAAVGRTPWTILRPSMIFGDGDDRNISRLVHRIRAGGWLPAIGRHSLHQPVFVQDVVDAIIACPVAGPTVGRTYAIAGAAPLSWQDLAAEVGRVVGRRPRWLPVPGRLAVGLLSTAERVGVRLPVQAEQVQRLLEDKTYDIGPASRDMGYQPLGFSTGLARTYGGDAVA